MLKSVLFIQGGVDLRIVVRVLEKRGSEFACSARGYASIEAPPLLRGTTANLNKRVGGSWERRLDHSTLP